MTTDRWRLLLALTNATLGVSLVALAAWTFFVRHPAQGMPARPRPAPYLPMGAVPGDETVELVSREIDAPVLATPTPAEDVRALADPERDFAAAYRVLLAALDPDPTACRCIVVPRATGEQLTLAPGDRLDNSYLLLSIQCVPGKPRGARLRFSDLAHGVVLAVTLAPAP